MLNIKELAVSVHSEQAKTMYLRAEGPCTVTAAMIETGHDVEIINPDHVICTLDAGAKINMELIVTTGKGYVPAANIRVPAFSEACIRKRRFYRRRRLVFSGRLFGIWQL